MPAPGAEGPHPAGFWRRYLAYCIDWSLLAPVLYFLLRSPASAAWSALLSVNRLLQDWLLGQLGSGAALPSPLSLSGALMQDTALFASVQAAMHSLTTAVTQILLLGAAVAAIYFIGFEASRWQATPGKRLLDLTVVDMRGGPVGWRRAGLRFLAGSLSWLSLNLGHAMAGWRADGRALHDLIAGTQVQAHSPMPRWGRWLLYAQLMLLLAVILGLFGRLVWLLGQLSAADAP